MTVIFSMIYFCSDILSNPNLFLLIEGSEYDFKFSIPGSVSYAMYFDDTGYLVGLHNWNYEMKVQGLLFHSVAHNNVCSVRILSFSSSMLPLSHSLSFSFIA